MSYYWNPTTEAGRAALDAMITRQAEIIAYIDDYRLLMIATLAIFPFVFVFKSVPRHGQDAAHSMAFE